ncbi:MAG: DUF2165 family protein [Pseudomonadota bacterium]
MEQVILLSQTGALSVITAWLFLGVRDNILYPLQNRQLTDIVLCMQALSEEYPEIYAELSYRKITSTDLQKRLFHIIVAAEVMICLVLAVAILVLLGAVIGAVPAERAQPLALLGALGFTMIWAGFLVAGNHFAYWLCHKDLQLTHYQMTLWGLGTMIFILIGHLSL